MISRSVWKERLAFAALALITAWLFFVEYLPPLKRVHFIWDFESYHFPLLNQAFQQLRAGSFPEWDPAVYCGIPLAGNMQAALFYPPVWLLFAANWGNAVLSYWSLHIYVALHFAAGMLLAFMWLRESGRSAFAAFLGGLCFAFPGFALSEVQHLGASTGITWFPLALWGIEQSSRSRSWRPMVKVTMASALCFLAGYPFTWMALALTVIVYAVALPGRRRLLTFAVAALAVSLLAAMVQILPAIDAAAAKLARPSFGGGLSETHSYLSFFIPNYFDQGRQLPPAAGEPYLYLGALVLFAILWCAFRRGPRAIVPAVLLAAACVAVIADPRGLLRRALGFIPLLDQAVREWNLLSCLAPASALLVAAAVDDCLAQPPPSRVLWLQPLAAILALGFSARLVWAWAAGGVGLFSGWASLIDAAVALSCLAFGLLVLRTRPNGLLMASLAILVFADLKAFGTGRRFNAGDGNLDPAFATDARNGGPDFAGMQQPVLQQLRADSTFRVLFNDNPALPDLRHHRLASAQGSDPLMPARYREEIEDVAVFLNERTFALEPSTRVLRRLGIRYVFTVIDSGLYRRLLHAPGFRMLEPPGPYYVVFGLADALPVFRWPGPVTVSAWTPERREFTVDSSAGGSFVLLENRYPGWHAFVDETEVPVLPHSHTFQQVAVPAGGHRLMFRYRAPGMRLGAGISAVTVAVLVLALVFTRNKAGHYPPHR